MKLEEMMNTDVATLKPDNTIKEARELMEERKIRHLPIVDDGGGIVGVLSDRDMKEAIPSTLIGKQDMSLYDTPLSKIMTEDPMTAHPLDFVEDAAVLFYENGIGCLPVVSSGKVVGIVTETDLLYRYIELTGASKPGSQIEIRVPDVAGVLYGVAKVFYENRANVLSVLVYPDKERLDYKILAIRVKTMNPLGIIEGLRKEGYDVIWPKLPGMEQ